MSWFRFSRSVGGVALGACLAGHAPIFAQTPPTEPRVARSGTALELEPKAIEILKATSSRLAGAHTLTFTAVETFESPSRQGVPLVYGNKSEVTLQRPNMLRVILTGDSPASEFYYDGKTMTAYAPAENLIATAVAPATIDATLEAAFHSAAIYFPFTDLIVANPYGDLAPWLKHAYYVGQSKIFGGTTTDIVAYAANRVFIEMWVGTEDKLPREIHAIYLDDPDLLRHNLALSDWQLDQPVPAGAFKVANVSGAQSMAFAPPESSRGQPPRDNAAPAVQR